MNMKLSLFLPPFYRNKVEALARECGSLEAERDRLRCDLIAHETKLVDALSQAAEEVRFFLQFLFARLLKSLLIC